MRFNIANKAPITVSIDGTDYQLPLMRRPFWVKWASELDARRTEEATSLLSPTERAKMLLIYPVEPIMHADMTKRLYTMDGCERVIRESASKATPPVPKDVLDPWLEDLGMKDLESLAIRLSAIIDFAEVKGKPTDDSERTGDPDPLASSKTA
jgi:hypothetical protein